MLLLLSIEVESGVYAAVGISGYLQCNPVHHHTALEIA